MKTLSFPFAFFEGKIVPIHAAKVSVMTNAFQYGTGFFGGIRGYYNKEKKRVFLFRLSDHYDRFVSSAKLLRVRLPYTEEDFFHITCNLVKKNKPTSDVYLRPMAYAHGLDISPDLSLQGDFGFTMYMLPLGEYVSTHNGLSVCISTWRRNRDNSIPSRAKITGAYMNSSLARYEAKINGYDEAIFLTEDGYVSEGSAANIFIVRNNTLVTPPVSCGILEGITRRTIIALAQELGIPCIERNIDRSELYICDEMFFSGTGVQVSWISHVDKRLVGSGKRGKITELLQDLYFKIVYGNSEKHLKWCTEVT